MEGLIRKLAEILPYPLQQIEEGVMKWVKDGLLKYDVRDGRLVWNWR